MADKCYGFNNDGGCQKWEIPTCRDSSDVFESRTGYLNFSSDVVSYDTNSSYRVGVIVPVLDSHYLMRMMKLDLMDPSLDDMFDPDESQRCIHVGLLCVEHYAKDRPDMSDIISLLTNKSVAITLPTRPAFYFGRKISEGETYSRSIESNINSTKENSTSIEVEPR
ncbi:unnamed protein product [Lupinus luteus]|uniref:Uncharacterized protein n=1 Tax=Lupinus luteus TaxID=3873 RepID=A0AAV1YI34_LUPLU